MLAASAAAFDNWVLAVPQIELTLPPALIKMAAEARAMKAINSVYSIRSWPDSSRQKVHDDFLHCFLSLGLKFITVRQSRTRCGTAADGRIRPARTCVEASAD